MLTSMLIALYTSRVVLQALGVDDYGLYNIVGGVVSMITIITGGMTTATQRFLSYELGKGDSDRLTHVFSTCVLAHLVIAGVFIIISETVGLWFLIKYIQVPDGRYSASLFVYQFSVFSVCMNILFTPYSACILSHEKVSIYAIIGVFDSILKLLIAIGVATSKGDRLIIYALLMMLISIVDFIAYKTYCRFHYEETKIKLKYHPQYFKKIFSFASYTILGQGGMVAANQGNNILVNMFYSVKANAAMAIATQVNGALSGLTSNFYLAYQPQITKAYSSNDLITTSRLILGTSKLSFYLVFLVSIPILCNIDYILKVWLGTVPEYTSIFCLFFIVSSMVNSFGNPYMTGVYATGDIKKLQIISVALYLSDLVFVYILFFSGFPAYYAPATKLFIDCCLTLTRILVAKDKIPSLSMSVLFLEAILPVSLVVIISVVITYVVVKVFPDQALLDTTIVTILALGVVFLIGLNRTERYMVKDMSKQIIKRMQ